MELGNINADTFRVPEHRSLFRLVAWKFLQQNRLPELPDTPDSIRNWADIDLIPEATIRAGVEAFRLVVGLASDCAEAKGFERLLRLYASNATFRGEVNLLVDAQNA